MSKDLRAYDLAVIRLATFFGITKSAAGRALNEPTAVILWQYKPELKGDHLVIYKGSEIVVEGSVYDEEVWV